MVLVHVVTVFSDNIQYNKFNTISSICITKSLAHELWSLQAVYNQLSLQLN